MQKTCNRESYALFRRKSTVLSRALFFGLPSKTDQKINTLKSSILKIGNLRKGSSQQEDHQPTVSALKASWNQIVLCYLLSPMLHAFNVIFCLLKALKVIAIPCIMVIAVFYSLCLSAQTPRKDSGADALTTINQLRVGDIIPQSLWHYTFPIINHPDGLENLKLNDLRGKKLIILDFWATWCKSCIDGFPNLEMLKKSYPDELEILLVNSKQTKDTKQRIDNFLSKNKEQHNYHLTIPYVLEDTIFQALFEHRSIPHVVWLDGDLQYLGASYGHDVNKKNIDLFLSHQITGFAQKDEFSKNQYIRAGVDPVPYSLSKFKEGSRSQGLKAESNHDSVRYTITNKPLSYLFEKAFQINNLPKSLWVFNPDDRLDEFVKMIKRPALPQDYYCFTASVPAVDSLASLTQILAGTLKDVFKVTARVQDKVTEVLVIEPTAALNSFKTEGGLPQSRLSEDNPPLYLQNVHISGLGSYLSTLFRMPVMVRSTQMDLSVDLTLPHDIYSMTDLQLVGYITSIGFKVQKESRKLKFVEFKSL